MSDRIGVMNKGRFVQIGTPREIYGSPSSRFVSEFMGEVNVLDVEVGSAGRIVDVATKQPYVTPPASGDFTTGSLVVRPEDMRFVAPGGADNCVPGTIYNEYLLGSRIQYQVRVGDKRVFLVEKLRDEAGPSENGEVTVGWDAKDSMLFPASRLTQ